MKKIIPALLLFFLAISPALFAQQNKYTDSIEKKIQLVIRNLRSNIEVEGEPEWTLEERMKFYHVNGVSIALIRNFKMEWARGFGWADSAEQRPVTPATLFQAGSISKSLNAVGVLRLAQEGKLNLYRDINGYLKSWKFPYDSLSHGKKITIANLLSHTAGLTVHGFPGYEKGEPIPSLQQVLDGIKPANTAAVRSAFEPSLRSEYSGGGTMISQMIVQDVSNQSYADYMRDNVLQPMGMNNSSYRQPPSAENQKILATAYYDDGKEVKGKYHIYPEQAAAGFWTNPTDLAKYVIEMQLSLQGQSNKVLTAEYTRLMLTPYIDKSAALGAFIDSKGGEKYFSHNGKDEGFVARYCGSFDGGNGVIIMTNTDDFRIINEIENSVASVYRWKDYYKPFMTLKKRIIANNVLESYVGQYRITVEESGQYILRPGGLFTVSKQGLQLRARSGDGPTIDIYPDTENVFFPKTSDTDITFVKDDKGGIAKIIIHENGKYIECQKVK
ncbi:MAG TPA: serine hydrolase domain-containing protein [Puia sp.]|uniref:serine hydrolase domain-containing protein n=1 Tax=Puia sp. TaxID=2045100 RepID=UPI002B74EFFC|nr:serine hydrolase domain-containing protein [Puia sp.]HVU97426.1 serine hydrolase domain-containing protein [Puia sp.]